MDDPVDPAEKTRSARRTTLITLAVMVPWTVGWIVLMEQADFPKSFGFTLGHGKGALFVAFVYSYVLVERHHWWDIALFAWMWGPVLGFVGWIVRKKLRTWTRPRFSLFDEAS